MTNQALRVGVTAAALGGGCISHDETVYRDDPRAKVEFESETSAWVFYEALSHRPAGQTRESTTRVQIPILLDHKERVVSGPNGAFNDAVARCDTNQDGQITELEA
jgi:hypothetical protein